ncbi:MAG: hypothetical protein VX777_08965 [Chlamydiota bacterium]|nr:hypothetical protein [Chlamydiota bacterium]
MQNISNYNSKTIDALDLANTISCPASKGQSNPYIDLFENTVHQGSIPYVKPYHEESITNSTTILSPVKKNWAKNIDLPDEMAKLTPEMKKFVTHTTQKACLKIIDILNGATDSPASLKEEFTKLAKLPLELALEAGIKVVSGAGAGLGYLTTNQKASEIYNTAEIWFHAKNDSPEFINNLLHYFTRWSEDPSRIDGDLAEIERGQQPGNTWEATCFDVKTPNWDTVTASYNFATSLLSLDKEKIRSAFNDIFKASPLEMRNLFTYVYLNDHPELSVKMSPEFDKLYRGWQKEFNNLSSENQEKIRGALGKLESNATTFDSEIKTIFNYLHSKPNCEDLKTICQTLDLSDGKVMESTLQLAKLVNNATPEDLAYAKEMLEWSRENDFLNEESIANITSKIANGLHGWQEQSHLRDISATVLSTIPTEAGTLSKVGKYAFPVVKVAYPVIQKGHEVHQKYRELKGKIHEMNPLNKVERPPLGVLSCRAQNKSKGNVASDGEKDNISWTVPHLLKGAKIMKQAKNLIVPEKKNHLPSQLVMQYLNAHNKKKSEQFNNPWSNPIKQPPLYKSEESRRKDKFNRDHNRVIKELNTHKLEVMELISNKNKEIEHAKNEIETARSYRQKFLSSLKGTFPSNDPTSDFNERFESNFQLDAHEEIMDKFRLLEAEKRELNKEKDGLILAKDYKENQIDMLTRGETRYDAVSLLKKMLHGDVARLQGRVNEVMRNWIGQFVDPENHFTHFNPVN